MWGASLDIQHGGMKNSPHTNQSGFTPQTKPGNSPPKLPKAPINKY